MLRGQCTDSSETRAREAAMSEVNDAALDSLDEVEADDTEELQPVNENETDEVPAFTEEDLGLESPEADSVDQKKEVRIDEDEYR
jgi:hypothetical protein